MNSEEIFGRLYVKNFVLTRGVFLQLNIYVRSAIRLSNEISVKNNNGNSKLCFSPWISERMYRWDPIVDQNSLIPIQLIYGISEPPGGDLLPNCHTLHEQEGS